MAAVQRFASGPDCIFSCLPPSLTVHPCTLSHPPFWPCPCLLPHQPRRHQLQQIARVLRDTDPSLFAKLQQLGAEDCMFAYRWVAGWVASGQEAPRDVGCGH